MAEQKHNQTLGILSCVIGLGRFIVVLIDVLNDSH